MANMRPKHPEEAAAVSETAEVKADSAKSETAKSLFHIPFCAHLCAYCDFAKVLYSPKWAFSYVQELKKEIGSFSIDRVETLYLGGGTPSVFTP
jgi:coproporphyrinogen III oxidase-like Fe-S oxidoreductase